MSSKSNDNLPDEITRVAKQVYVQVEAAIKEPINDTIEQGSTTTRDLVLAMLGAQAGFWSAGAAVIQHLGEAQLISTAAMHRLHAASAQMAKDVQVAIQQQVVDDMLEAGAIDADEHKAMTGKLAETEAIVHVEGDLH